jgi:tetratricopeptide (TPR) repeat protein
LQAFYGAILMKECPQCGNGLPDSFHYCPADGSELSSDPQGKKPAQIRIRTLVLGILILALASVLSFASVFFYQYWKPKYGSLVIKTTPAGAIVTVDGRLQGASPITISDLRTGGHQLKVAKAGYREFVQQVTVMPYATENLHWNLEPIIPQLSNEQLAEVEAWRKKLENAQRENILLPPPDDYNVIYFADKILAIDPANTFAMDVKGKVVDTVRRLAEFAYAREDWLESEKQFKNLALLLPNDVSIEERLTDIAAKIDESLKDREKQIQDLKAKAENAMRVGNLLPPDKENALEAIRNIQRLDKNNPYVRESLASLKELLQSRADTKIAGADWQGARNDFRLILQYFPEDNYSKTRLATVEAKLVEMAQQNEQPHIQKATEEQQTKGKIAALRQSAVNYFRTGSYEKSISEWQEYLKSEPDSDEAYFYIGASYQDQKQLDTAILNFEKCIALNPNNVMAHMNLGILYDYHRNNLKAAEEHLRKAKELGGAEKYSPERLQAMIQDLQDRAKANSILKVLFAVEHKHTFSSCRGNLRFTEEGVEFRTSETDHSFYEPYKGLRAFVIQGNELTIRTRNNKKYNFRFLNASDAGRVKAWNASTRTIELSGKAD